MDASLTDVPIANLHARPNRDAGPGLVVPSLVMSKSDWLASFTVGVGLLASACGGAADELAAQGQDSWPPLSLGGREPARGPLEDPALNPVTLRPYDDIPY